MLKRKLKLLLLQLKKGPLKAMNLQLKRRNQVKKGVTKRKVKSKEKMRLKKSSKKR